MKKMGLEPTGIIFDIQRASLHDGPGIRTTVFLKGCPLRCLWCHNPEAAGFQPQLFFSEDRCVFCGSCASVCSENVHQISDGIHKVDFARCTVCADCIEVCNHKALKISGKRMTSGEVMLEVMADREFYEASRGGLTLSGGEPMAQFAFMRELLSAARAQGIHTCLETCGHASASKFKEILPFVDLFLFDYKLTGTGEHKKYTGLGNQQILASLDLLYHSGKPVILRCPVIPGINDTRRHFRGIGRLFQRYPDLQAVEILPYHDMGNPKRSSIGLPMTLNGLKTTPPELAEEWLVQIKNLGCEKVRIG